MYKIIDNHTGFQIGKLYTNRQRASNRVDKLDKEYGACRYSVQFVG